MKYQARSYISTWWFDRLNPAIDAALPSRWLLLLLPLGIFATRGSGRVTVALGALILPAAYALYPSYLKHYGLATAPAFILLVLAGEQWLRRKFPAIGYVFLLATSTLAIGSLPEVRRVHDGYMHAPFLADINAKLAQLDHTPAVVLFHYESGKADVHEEPVYNLDTAWPDDAVVIRAQDLGVENWRIYEYYSRREPQRFFYRYDRTNGELTPLGWAKELRKNEELKMQNAERGD